MAIPLKISEDKSKALQYVNPIESLSEKPTVSEIKQAITYISHKYGLDEPQLMVTLNCESGLRYNAVGDHGKAYGVAQFHLATFKAYCSGDYYSAKDQLKCVSDMFKRGLQLNWSCWRSYFYN